MSDDALSDTPDDVVSDTQSPPQRLLDGFSIEYRPAHQPRRRQRYDPRDSADGWWLIEEEWNGCKWRIVGREPVDDVSVTMG